MTVQKIAERLHELMVQGDKDTAFAELYAKDAVAIEPKFPGFERVEGLDNIIKKTDGMVAMIQEVKGREVSDVILTAANHFAINIKMDAVMKDGSAFKVDEICLYEVRDGKIISEQFFY